MITMVQSSPTIFTTNSSQAAERATNDESSLGGSRAPVIERAWSLPSFSVTGGSGTNDNLHDNDQLDWKR